MMKIKTLIADDNIGFIKYILNITSEIDNLKITHITTDVKETLETLKQNHFDLILLYLLMSSLNGVEIIKNIHNENINNNSNIIVISGELSSFKDIMMYPIVIGVINKVNDSTLYIIK